MMVVQDAFQICAIQHGHGTPAAPAGVNSLTLVAHFHKIISLSLIAVTLFRYLHGHQNDVAHRLNSSGQRQSVYNATGIAKRITDASLEFFYTFQLYKHSRTCARGIITVRNCARLSKEEGVSIRHQDRSAGSIATSACAQQLWRAIVH